MSNHELSIAKLHICFLHVFYTFIHVTTQEKEPFHGLLAEFL